jgi:hypothetical protein
MALLRCHLGAAMTGSFETLELAAYGVAEWLAHPPHFVCHGRCLVRHVANTRFESAWLSVVGGTWAHDGSNSGRGDQRPYGPLLECCL